MNDGIDWPEPPTGLDLFFDSGCFSHCVLGLKYSFSTSFTTGMMRHVHILLQPLSIRFAPRFAIRLLKRFIRHAAN